MTVGNSKLIIDSVKKCMDLNAYLVNETLFKYPQIKENNE